MEGHIWCVIVPPAVERFSFDLLLMNLIEFYSLSTTVDFGFARALSPSDMTKPISEKIRRMDSTPFDLSENDSSRHSNSLGVSTSSRRSLGRSVSRTFNRQMSALGHRSYAAPEVMKGVKPNSQHNAVRLPGDDPVDLTNNLSANVSRYGMMADAFSAGSTIRYAMVCLVCIASNCIFHSISHSLRCFRPVSHPT